MAHYAFIKDNIVTEVITGKDETETAPEGFADWEEYYLTKRPDQDACKRTSYNTQGNVHLESGIAFRGNYAGIGHTYDSYNDVFYEPQTFPSWVLNETSWIWEAPTPMPELTEEEKAAGSFYQWNEETTSWDLVE
tara:strand:+ start:1557 stop:1961 length:405 start_codon:yes stop_codon:yes gene_type:complete